MRHELSRLAGPSPSGPSPNPRPELDPDDPAICSADDGAAVEALAFEDEGPAGPALAGAEPALGLDPGGLLSRDQFAAGLRAAFGLAGGLLGLATLRSAPELETFAPAAGALYDTAAEVPWLRWLIAPESVWLQRTIALGAFAVPVGAAAAGELRQRAASAAAARKAAQNGDSQPLDGQ